MSIQYEHVSYLKASGKLKPTNSSTSSVLEQNEDDNLQKSDDLKHKSTSTAVTRAVPGGICTGDERCWGRSHLLILVIFNNPTKTMENEEKHYNSLVSQT